MDNGIPQNGEGVDTAVLIPDGLADAGKYALLEDGTFTNTASANVTVLGQKLWKTMPAQLSRCGSAEGHLYPPADPGHHNQGHCHPHHPKLDSPAGERRLSLRICLYR